MTPRPGIADRLARLLRHPTVSGSGAPFADFEASLRELYPLLHEHLELERIGEPGLLYRWPGSDAAASPVVLMAHIDVVPVDERDGWSHPPFGGVVRDGWVFGRGALDDKGPLIVILEAVENLLAEGFRPTGDVYLSFGGDEETGGTVAKQIAQTLHDRGIHPWLVIDEGGAVVDPPLPGISRSAAMIGVGEKGLLTLRLVARGEGGHASAPPPVTEVARISRAVARLRPTMFPPRTPAATVRMLQLVGEHADRPWMRTAYRVLAALPRVTARLLAAGGGETAALVRTTIAPTMLSGGTAANVLPSRAEAVLNLRVAIGETVDGAIARVRRTIRDRRIAIEVEEANEPSPESSTAGPQFALLAAALADSHPDAVAIPYVMMAATDSRHFHRFFPAVFRFAPLGMSDAQRASIHGVDERVEVSELERGERFHRSLLTRLQEPRP